MTSGTKRKAPALPKGLQTQNRFTALEFEEVYGCFVCVVYVNSAQKY